MFDSFSSEFWDANVQVVCIDGSPMFSFSSLMVALGMPLTEKVKEFVRDARATSSYTIVFDEDGQPSPLPHLIGYADAARAIREFSPGQERSFEKWFAADVLPAARGAELYEKGWEARAARFSEEEEALQRARVVTKRREDAEEYERFEEALVLEPTGEGARAAGTGIVPMASAA